MTPPWAGPAARLDLVPEGRRRSRNSQAARIRLRGLGPQMPLRLPARAITTNQVKERKQGAGRAPWLRGTQGACFHAQGGESAGNGLLPLTHQPQACHSSPRLLPHRPGPSRALPEVWVE